MTFVQTPRISVVKKRQEPANRRPMEVKMAKKGTSETAGPPDCAAGTPSPLASTGRRKNGTATNRPTAGRGEK